MESAFSDILFFFFIPSSLPCLALFALLSASFLFTLELKRAILRLVREMMAVLFSMVKGVEFQSQFDRASRRRKDRRRGMVVHVDVTWYMRVAATSKPKGNKPALLITDIFEACGITI